MNARWVTILTTGAGVILMPGQLAADMWRVDRTYRPQSGLWQTGPEIAHDNNGGGIDLTNAVDFPGWRLETINDVDRSFVAGLHGFDAWRDNGSSNSRIRYRSNAAPATDDHDWWISPSGQMVFEWHLWVDSASKDFPPEIRMGNGYKLGVRYETSAKTWVGSNGVTLFPPAPMTADEWHVVRLEYTPHAGSFTFMIDSPTNVYTGGVAGSSTGAYISWGRVSNGGTGTFYTHYAVWGQGAGQIGEMGALVPTPSSWVLAVLGLMLIRRRWPAR